MNKKLLTIAIGAALAAAPMFAAQADVVLYGRVQAEINQEDIDNQDNNVNVDDVGGQSRWGIKATEKLGNGLTAVGVLEFQLDPSNNNGQKDRAQFVGLTGGWGTFALGSFQSPYKTTGGTSYDPFTATHLQARRAGGMTGASGFGTNGFVRNTIVYASPKLSGFSFAIGVIPDISHQDIAGVTGSAYSLAAKYENGPFEVFYARNEAQYDDAGFSDESMDKIGGQVVFGNHTINGQYEWIQNSRASSTGASFGGNPYSAITAGDDGDIWYLGYQFKMGNNIFAANVGQTNSDVHNGNDTDYYALGMIHKFSKYTRAFGGYANSDSNVYGNRNVWTVGLRKDF
jgi:predicted porin